MPHFPDPSSFPVYYPAPPRDHFSTFKILSLISVIASAIFHTLMVAGIILEGALFLTLRADRMTAYMGAMCMGAGIIGLGLFALLDVMLYRFTYKTIKEGGKTTTVQTWVIVGIVAGFLTGNVIVGGLWVASLVVFLSARDELEREVNMQRQMEMAWMQQSMYGAYPTTGMQGMAIDQGMHENLYFPRATAPASTASSTPAPARDSSESPSRSSESSKPPTSSGPSDSPESSDASTMPSGSHPRSTSIDSGSGGTSWRKPVKSVKQKPGKTNTRN